MSKWIEFKIYEKEQGKKTNKWLVITKENRSIIGTIKWYGAWRKYCFFPKDKTVWEEDCLRDIANFIENETKTYKGNKNV